MSNNSREKKPFVSVIIPAYNAEHWITEAINSALKCSVYPLEVIVVDDGSTDSTYKIASMFGDCVTVIKQMNSGVVSARKTGIDCSSGQYVKLLDSDDLLPPGSIDSFINLSKLYPGEIFLSRVAAFSSSTTNLCEEMYNIGYKPKPFALIRNEFLLTQATHSGAWLIPREVFFTNDLFGDGDIRLGEEYEFCLNLVKSKTPVRYVDTVAYFARNHNSPSRLSRTNDESRHIAQANLIEKAYTYILNNIQLNNHEALTILARLCWSRGRECVRIDCLAAARKYFDLSRKIDSKIIIPGTSIYRILCALIGPFASEATLDIFKRILKPHREI